MFAQPWSFWVTPVTSFQQYKLSGIRGWKSWLAWTSRRRTAQSVSCPCLVFVQIFRKIVFGVCLLSGLCPDLMSGVCVSRFCPVSSFCPESCEKCCPMSVYPNFFCLVSIRCPDSFRILEKKPSHCLAGQGRDRAVWTFTVLVRRLLTRIQPESVDHCTVEKSPIQVRDHRCL